MARSWAVLVIVCACTFFDPLDQAGLGVILLPADTALYVGSSFTARGRMANAYGDQYPSEHIRYAGLDPSATVGPDGTVTGVSYGRARVVVTRGDFADMGWVSVVPLGTLALSKISEQSTVDIVNADGSGFTSIASSGQFGGGAPAWLPGNAGLVYQFATPGGAGSTQIFVTDLAGNSTSLAASGRDPRVSRDGNWVYFGDAGAIRRVHPNGTGLELVSGGGDYTPDPSPDSTQLVFASTRFTGGGSQLAVRDLIAGAEESLSTQGWMPRWAPSGNEIAYWSGDISSQPARGAIFVIGANGAGAHQVSAAGRRYWPQGLDWSPDGQWLLARSDSTLDLIQVTTGLTLPLGYAADYHLASWRW
jgi:Tol biopolymer transport system component